MARACCGRYLCKLRLGEACRLGWRFATKQLSWVVEAGMPCMHAGRDVRQKGGCLGLWGATLKEVSNAAGMCTCGIDCLKRSVSSTLSQPVARSLS